jgi:FtsP/CotA-like multicopper oxidase with cupredoxin domain
VEPGDTLTVDVQNKLGPEAPGDALMTGLHRPNTTSLHVHGWHVSPREDDVFTLIAPGSSKTYVYHLPQTHPAGTFWYHAHGHGSSSLQAGWMAGALVVHDKDHRRLPPDVVLLLTQVWAGVFAFFGSRRRRRRRCDGVAVSHCRAKQTKRAATRRLAARRWRRRGTPTTPSTRR